MSIRAIWQALVFGALSVPLAVGLSSAATTVPLSSHQETLLMFVGEHTKVLGIASRREQSAWQAPAIARVLTRDELQAQGTYTLSDALQLLPGFHMAKKEYGTLPYLRGIPNSVLFLYDTVPVASEVNKSIHHLDQDLPLWAAKRVEIINGPGSVLWGPDAFAGIVNVVPLSGKDLDGTEAGVLYGAPGDQRGCFVNAGLDAGLWDGFFSLSARKGEEDDERQDIVRFRGENQLPLPPEDRMGSALPGESEYIEAYGQLSWSDWLNFSGRLGYNQKPYTMTSGDGSISWGETRNSPFGFLKLEAKRELDRLSALKFAGYYSHLTYEHEVIDLRQKQKEATLYGEMVYDRSIMTGTGILTGGVSYRQRNVDDAPVWNGYLPGYLESDNPAFFPLVLEKSYDTRLWSAFGQFMKTIRNVDLFAGVRWDSHEQYDDQASLSAGLGWSPASDWRCKLQYGTAYRTPFARQLYVDEDPAFEEIESLNLQVAWDKPGQAGFSATGFYQQIDHHVAEDPYAGLSLPNHQDIYGVELEGYLFPHKTLKIQANLTHLANSGPDESYRYLESITIDPDGNIQENYAINSYPYDLGADLLFNLLVTWQPTERLSFYARAGYVASRSLIFPRDDAFERVDVPGFWDLDATAVIRDAFFEGGDLTLSVKNLTDQGYETPGTYDLIDGEPISVTALLTIRW